MFSCETLTPFSLIHVQSNRYRTFDEKKKKKLRQDFGLSLSVGNLGNSNSHLNLPLSSEPSVNQVKLEDVDMVPILAKYDNHKIRFRLSLSSTLVELQQKVAKGLKLEASTYHVMYKDEEDESTLIACDEDLQHCIHTSMSLGNISVTVQLEPKKTIWPFRPLPVENQGQSPQLNLPSYEFSASVGNTNPRFEDGVTIKAKCVNYDYTLKFRLSLLSTLEELQQEVAKRRPDLKSGTYHVKYKDEEDMFTLIACDKDFQECMHSSRFRGNTFVLLQLEPK